MKRTYPNYRQKGTEPIERKLKSNDKQILLRFLTFCRTTSNEYKVQCRKSEILQIRDIIEKEFDKWNLEDLRGFLAIVNHDKRSIWTKKCLLITLGMFLKWNYKDWSERFNNLDDVRKLQKLLKPDNEEKYKELPEAEEIDKAIRTAKYVRDKLYVSMCSEAGLPPKVQTELKWEDIKIDDPQPNISTLQYHRGKNKTTFVFPLGKTTTYYLKQWKQEYCFPNVRKDDYIFPAPRNRSNPYSPVSAGIMLKRLFKRAGIDKNIYPYKLRHKTLSESYDIFTEEVHRKLFGHVRGSSQTKTYSHKKDNEKTLAIALDKLHKVEKVTKEQESKWEKRINFLEEKLGTIEKENNKVTKLWKQVTQEVRTHINLVKNPPKKKSNINTK